jgi:sulfonate transport system substrate-binding protein
MKKTILTILFSVSVIAMLTGCTTSKDDSTVADDVQATKVVNIGSFSRAIDYAPYIVAKNNGLFDEVAAKYGVNINYVEFQTLPAINEALATNNLDIVFEAEPPAIIGKAAGIGLSIVSPGVSLVQEIVVPSESDINEVTDLKGKKIAVPSGSSSHYGLNMILKQAGLTGDDVEIIDMNPQDGKAAFVARQIDGWAIWPPFVEQEQYAKTGRVLRGSNVFIQSIAAMRDSFKEENPELAKDLVAAIKESQQWILQNTAEAQKIVADELGIELGVVELAWGKHNFNPTIGVEEIADIQNKADFLFEMGLVKTNVNVDDDLIDLY